MIIPIVKMEGGREGGRVFQNDGNYYNFHLCWEREIIYYLRKMMTLSLEEGLRDSESYDRNYHRCK